MRRFGVVVVAAVALACVPSASAGLLRAETVLPPGQSGFVDLPGVAAGTGSPHLYDQTDLFTSFRWKNAQLGRPGETETPRDGVKIVRDEYGVPAVTGATEDDMWWGAGYAVAQDRLFQLYVFKYATTGRLGELIGKGRLDDDRVVRNQLYTRAERDAMYAKLAPVFRNRFERLRDGINAYVARVRGNPLELPAEFPLTGTQIETWTTDDSVAIGIFLARTIPTNADPEGLELSNMRGLQLGGPKALEALVPLRNRKALTTIPREEGSFPSQPGRTRKQERAAFKRSHAFVEKLPYPTPAQAGALLPFQPSAAASTLASFSPKLGGSYMFAARRSDGHAFLFNGPQLGFDAPEKLLELELHGPGLDVRGMTAPGVPIIGAGFNAHGVAWGVTTGASDTDDLFVEELAGDEEYRFKGETRKMDCRDETLKYDTPLSDIALNQQVPDNGEQVVRLCRTIHGPVEARLDGVAYARRYAGWLRELETLEGLADVNAARNLQEVDAGVRKMTWNENLMAVDAKGSIGFWHPGLHPLRSSRWDERLPLPGTGEAEWRGLLDRAKIPAVVNPKQGWLANWNNLPSVGWTAGDGTARKRLDGKFFRMGWLARLVREYAKAPTFEGAQSVVREAGTVAQQFPVARSRIRRAARGATGEAKTVLDALMAWDGSYDRTDADGTVDPGVAAWDAFRAAAGEVGTARFGEAAKWLTSDSEQHPLNGQYHHGVPYHYFDATHAEAHGLATLAPAGLREAAVKAHAVLVKRFGTGEAAKWREPRRMYKIGSLGAGSPGSIPFYDRGTYEQFVEVGP